MQEKQSLAIPAAIIAAGVVVAGAIFYVNSSRQVENTAAVSGAETRINVPAVRENDHLLGDPQALVKVVEYSDFECPYCKSFHTTMQEIMQSDYGQKGQVAWIYRHFPLERIHSKAKNEAAAAECAAELGGNLAFWKYANRLFEVTPSNDNLDPAELPKIAEFTGLDRAAFEQCLAEKRGLSRVEADLEEVLEAGGTGTPWSVVVAPNGKTFLINGAQPYAVVAAAINRALQEAK